MSELFLPGQPVRLNFEARTRFPDIATRRGVVEAEPVQTEGVVCVLWEQRRNVIWHRQEDLAASNLEGVCGMGIP